MDIWDQIYKQNKQFSSTSFRCSGWSLMFIFFDKNSSRCMNDHHNNDDGTHRVSGCCHIFLLYQKKKCRSDSKKNLLIKFSVTLWRKKNKISRNTESDNFLISNSQMRRVMTFILHTKDHANLHHHHHHFIYTSDLRQKNKRCSYCNTHKFSVKVHQCHQVKANRSICLIHQC